MTKISSAARTRHPCQTGYGRPRPSHSLACPFRYDRRQSLARLCKQLVPAAPNAFEHRHADRQIAVRIEKGRKLLRGSNCDELTDTQSIDWLQAIQPNGHTLRVVPNVRRWQVLASGQHNGGAKCREDNR